MLNGEDVFRTRLEAATGYELALAEALCEILGRGSHDLPAIVEGLCASDVAPPSGGEWTEGRLLEEIRRLGVGPKTGPAPAPRL